MAAPVIDFIVVAEFDINKGSSVKFQYPQPTGAPDGFLAEMMLPDGVHQREEDWTVFFLNRPTPSQKKEAPKKEEPKEKCGACGIERPIEAYIYRYSEQTSGWDMIGSDKKLVSMQPRKISIATRTGELIAAITPHKDLEFTQLEPLFSCVLTEEGVALGLRFSTDAHEQVFLKHLDTLLHPTEPAPAPAPARPDGPAPFLYCVNRVWNRKDDAAKRGAVVRAMTFCSRHQFVQVFKPLLIFGLDQFFRAPTADTLAALYQAVNALDLTHLAGLSYYQRALLRNGHDAAQQEFVAQVEYAGTRLKVKVPRTQLADEVGELQCLTLVRKFGAGVLQIYNALLLEKKVLFLGYGCPADETCTYVLSAIGLLCPPLRGLVQRAFPYTNLTSLDFLHVPGYVAGVANPMFEERVEWWDLCCNIQTGAVRVSPRSDLAQSDKDREREPHHALDAEFYARVNQQILSHFGEQGVRALFQEYTQHLIDMALGEAEFPDDARRKLETEGNRARCEAWKKTFAYEAYQEAARERREQSSIKDGAVLRGVRKLRQRRGLGAGEMQELYEAFARNITSEDQLIEFLSYFPEHSGGLFPVAVALFHPSDAVRAQTVRLLSTMDQLKEGSGFLQGLNAFILLAYDRLTKATPAPAAAPSGR